MSLDEVSTLVFDVMGTVVELDDSHRAWTQQVLQDWDLSSHQIDTLLEDVETAQTRLMDAVINGSIPWQPHRELRRRAVEVAMETGELSAITGEIRDQLAAATGHLKPWPDSPAALAILREHFTVAALPTRTCPNSCSSPPAADLPGTPSCPRPSRRVSNPRQPSTSGPCICWASSRSRR